MSQSSQVKSKKRVADHGEVFTAEREVKAMCDLVADECLRVDSRFLEPACGDGNFLAEILTRKLGEVTRRYKKNPYDWERNAILALSSIYGVEILEDNARICRERLYKLWCEKYDEAVPQKEQNDETKNSARFILKKNIVCGNALSLMRVDENQADTDAPIIFSEWTFPANDGLVKRRDFRLDVLLKENKYQENYSFFSGGSMEFENWMIDPVTGQHVPKPVHEFPPVHFRKISEEISD